MPDWTSHLSYVGIIVVLTLTGAGLPVPEEVPVIAAGLASYHGNMHPGLALASCLLGALMGDCLMYWIGYHWGRRVLSEFRWFARVVEPEREKQIEQMIARHGWKVFLGARFLVGLRSPVYLTAGILKVPFRYFLLIDSICATAVICTFFGLAYYFASHIETIVTWFRKSQYALTGVVVLAVASVAAWFWLRHRKRVRRIAERRLERSEHAPSRNGEPAQDAASETTRTAV